MSLPIDLLLVRHGQSESNVMVNADMEGHGFITDELMTVPDRSWHITEQGRMQADTTGKWIRDRFPTFDRYFVSPFTRTRETAGHLGLVDASWSENRAVRERSWGEIDSIPRNVFEKHYPENARLKKKEPLYWQPPAGESIASVAENRVVNLMGTLKRTCSGKRVIVVTHGEFIQATMLLIEEWSDEQYFQNEKDPAFKIQNGMVVQYTRVDPFTGKIGDEFSWRRMAYPVQDEGKWGMIETSWVTFKREHLQNEDLLNKAQEVERHL